jgi:type IV secretion system protein VirB8
MNGGGMAMKKKDGSALRAAAEAGAGFEVTVGDLARRSERRAWMVAGASAILALALAGGYVAILPLKEKVPYVVMADPFSGTASVAALRDDAFYQSLVAEEALSRSNVANYVVARESFDRELLKLRDWAQVNVMSAPAEQRAFAELHADTNPGSPAKLVGGSQMIRVRISSITPMYDGGPMAGATVRLQRNLFDRETGRTTPIDRRVVTLAFHYDASLQLDESLRWLNPMGFQVSQYRSDLDLTAPDEKGIDTAIREAVASANALGTEREAAIDRLRSRERSAGDVETPSPASTQPSDSPAPAPQGADPR